MSTISIETITDMLEDSILDADPQKTLLLIGRLKEAVRTDPEAVKWVVDPPNLTHLHELLTSCLGVPQKVMRVKERSENRSRRALMFVEAMEHGIKRVL